MATLDLALLKKHVKADDFTEDDAYLQHLLDVSRSAVIRATNRDESELISPENGEIFPELKQAILMLAAHWYNQRESVSAVQMHEVPSSMDALVKPFRKLA